MQCPSCGAYVSKDDVFCGECGQPLIDLAAAPQSEGQLADQVAPALPAPAAALPDTASAGRSWTVVAGVAAGFAVLLVLGLCVAGVLLLWPRSQDEVPVPVRGALIYGDDFGDPDSGWDVYAEATTWAGYRDGEYRLAIDQEEYVTWANPDLPAPLSDVEAEVEVRQVAGPLDDNFGLLVRYQDDDENFYWFQISGDGYYSVDRMQAGEWLTLVPWAESEAINQGLGAVNHLTVVCHGDQFAFYVNDAYLTTVTDDTFPAGSIGLAAGTFDEPGVDVRFDNVKVYALSE